MFTIYSRLGFLKNKPHLNVKQWILSKEEKQVLKAELLKMIHNQSSFHTALDKHFTQTHVSSNHCLNTVIMNEHAILQQHKYHRVFLLCTQGGRTKMLKAFTCINVAQVTDLDQGLSSILSLGGQQVLFHRTV